MNIRKRYITRNDCYNTNRKITPTGIMVHSTAAPGVMAAAFAERWDRPGVQKAIHFFTDHKEAVNVLPCEPGNVHRAWHCGRGRNGSGNDTMIAFEMCEPANLDDRVYFAAAYRNAVELAASLCREFHIRPQSILCHAEGHQRGIASNHGDVLHWFPRHGVDMDDFRAAVADRLSDEGKPQSGDGTDPAGGGVETAESRELYRVQVGAFRAEDEAKKLSARIKAAGYDDAYIKLVDGLYKVQAGAFRSRENAKELKARLEKEGFATYLVESTTQPADTAYAEWTAICNAQDVNVRTGPGTENGILSAWPRLGRGNEVDVIGEGRAADGKLWYHILIANEYEGWVSGEFLDRRQD